MGEYSEVFVALTRTKGQRRRSAVCSVPRGQCASLVGRRVNPQNPAGVVEGEGLRPAFYQDHTG